MGRTYSIAIQAQGDHASDTPPKISAVIRVDEDGTPQIIELTVGAADGGPIPPAVARNIDFAMLTDALTGVVSATQSPPDEEAAAPRPKARSVQSGQPAPADAPAAEERPYRRMPEVGEVLAVIRKTHSVGKLAQHFGVPRYTAQAWVNRLRRTGQLDSIDGGSRQASA